MTRSVHVTIPVNVYVDDVEDIIDDMICKLQDIPMQFTPVIMEGVFFMALFDEGYHEDDFWAKLEEYLEDAYIEFFESHTVFKEYEPAVVTNSFHTESRDEDHPSFVAHGLIHFLDYAPESANEDDSNPEVELISDVIPHHFQYQDRADLILTAQELATQTAEMFAEYDLSSNEDYSDMASGLQDLLENSFNVRIRNIDTFRILTMRKVIVVKLQQKRLKCGLPDLNIA